MKRLWMIFTKIQFPYFDVYLIHNCPGYDSHLKNLRTMLEGEKEFSLFDSSFCPEEMFRAPPETQTDKFWGRFIGLRPSPMLIRKYLVINELQEPPTNASGRTA